MYLKGILYIIFINACIKNVNQVIPETSDIKKSFRLRLYLKYKIKFVWKMGSTTGGPLYY